jgi:DNA polymerase III delta subunit
VPPITREVLRQQIASGRTGPLYVLDGDDEAEKDAVVAEFAEMVDEGIRAFNVDHLFGGDMEADDLIDASATLPMMVPRRIVIVHNAERLLIPKRESEAADAEQEQLEGFVAHAPAHATVVFACAVLDRRRRLIRLLLKEAHWVECGSLVAEAAGVDWVRARAERDQVPLDGSAVRALIDRARVEGRGSEPARVDLVRIRAGFERVAVYAMGQKTITGQDVAQVVTLTAEAKHFGIASAIETGNTAAALRELALALDGGASPYMVLGQLRWIVEDKVPHGRMPQAIDAVFRTDLALKSSPLDPNLLLERLVVELCAGAGRPANPVGRAARR